MDANDLLRQHQKEVSGRKLLTPHQEKRLAIRIEAARKRYQLAALQIDHVARTCLGLFGRVKAGHLTAERTSRLAKSELLTQEQLKQLEGQSRRRRAATSAAFYARLDTHVPTVTALLDRAHRNESEGKSGTRDREKAAKLLYELGVKSQKIEGLIRQAESLPDTPDPELLAVVRKRRAIFNKCKCELAEGNLRLVWNRAAKAGKRYGGGKEGLADLIQEGHTGLMRAVDKFEVRMGYRFSTSAARWIDQAMAKAHGDHGRAVRVPSHTREIAGLVYWARADLLRNGSEPSMADIVSHIKKTRNKEVTEDAAAKADVAVRPIAHFEDQGGDGQGEEALPDKRCEVEEADPEATAAVWRALNMLPYTMREILRLRYGFGDGWRYTLDECGHVFGLSREWARQMEKATVKRLQEGEICEMLKKHVG